MATTKKSDGGLTFEKMMKVERIGAPCASPDGKHVAFVTEKHDIKANTVRRTIKLLCLQSREIQELTPGLGNHTQPAWSPDGKHLAFVSSRDEKKGAQLWLLPTAGGEAFCLTSGYGGASLPVWSPDSSRIAFTRSIVVSDKYNPKKDMDKDEAKEPDNAKVYGLVNPKSSARIIDDLLFRPWDHWRDKRRNHIFLVDIKTKKTSDITPWDMDAPPISLSVDRYCDFAPDGKEIVFVMNPDKVVARSTNNSIFIMSIKGIKAAGNPRCISVTEACDMHPRYSPCGELIFYLGMDKIGYEADKTRIRVYDRKSKKTSVLIDRFDRSPYGFEFASGKNALIFSAEDRGRKSLYEVDVDSKKVMQLTCGTYNGAFCPIPGTDDLLVVRETTTSPADFHRVTPGRMKPFLGVGPLPAGIPTDAGAKSERLTHFGEMLNDVEMNAAEEFWHKGADGDLVHGFLIKPAGFNARKKYPLILLIHGGPQGAFADHFHYRWSAQAFAATGAVVAFLNPRGSTGYGQKFTDQISGDWGGRCYEDIMLGVDFMAKKYPFIDKNRMGAAGASFGGFMVNWIAGHTDRFKALATHDGVFFAETMAYTTDELWFDEREHGGLPHVNRKPYVKFSPHMFVKNFKTPALVIHGENDFRCPMSEGIGMFTAMQVMGVPSRFVHMPDECHWVVKPANSQVWYHEVLGWMTKYLEIK